MIKFFRKIRQNHIMENPPERGSPTGKTGKLASPVGRYLKYAIGEIVLVVIGILIALSINTWNENRKAEITKHILLQELKQEFQTNLKLIEEHEISLTESNNYLITVLNYSAGKEKGLPIDSLRKFSSKMVYINNLAITKSSLDGIIASGNIRLMDNELTALLTEFESDFNSYINISENFSQRFASKTTNDLMLTLNFYKPFHKFLYPDKPLEIHPSFKKTDEEFVTYIKNPDTYSTINELYIFELANKAWTSHLKLKVKNIITNIEGSQPLK